MKDLQRLKKEARSHKEAEKFELKYKKIKFVEKRKVIRKLQSVTKFIEKGCPSDDKNLSGVSKEEAESLQKKWKNFLIYIDVSFILIEFLTL